MISDANKSKLARSRSTPVNYPPSDIAGYIQAIDNFQKVFAIRPGEHVLMLTDPHLDVRITQAVYGLARGRGATFASYMAPTCQYIEIPEDVKPLLEKAHFVVSTWFASVFDPYCQALRRERGQRWVKITFFRNFDLLHTPQARFPVELVGDIVRATSRLFPAKGGFNFQFTDPRGSDFQMKYSEANRNVLVAHNRWRGINTADEAGAYVHYLPTHGPNFYDGTMLKPDGPNGVSINGVVYPQWAVGFERPFQERIGVEFKDAIVVAVHGKSEDAAILHEHLVGGILEELGCGHNPKAPRFDIYPAGSNSPGALHWGVNGLKPSAYIQKVLPNWEEPAIHMDLVTFDSTVRAGEQLVVDNGFLLSLRDPQVVKAAERYGDPVEVLEGFVL
jgi:hypothetical protein